MVALDTTQIELCIFNKPPCQNEDIYTILTMGINTKQCDLFIHLIHPLNQSLTTQDMTCHCSSKYNFSHIFSHRYILPLIYCVKIQLHI